MARLRWEDKQLEPARVGPCGVLDGRPKRHTGAKKHGQRHSQHCFGGLVEVVPRKPGLDPLSQRKIICVASETNPCVTHSTNPTSMTTYPLEPKVQLAE